MSRTVPTVPTISASVILREHNVICNSFSRPAVLCKFLHRSITSRQRGKICGWSLSSLCSFVECEDQWKNTAVPHFLTVGFLPPTLSSRSLFRIVVKGQGEIVRKILSELFSSPANYFAIFRLSDNETWICNFIPTLASYKGLISRFNLATASLLIGRFPFDWSQIGRPNQELCHTLCRAAYMYC